MGRLREFRRKLEEIQARRAARSGSGYQSVHAPERIRPYAVTPGLPQTRRDRAPREPRWSPFLQAVLRRASIVAPPPPRPAPVRLETACPGTVAELPGVGRVWVMEHRDPAWRQAACEIARCLSLPGSPARERLLGRLGGRDIRARDLHFVDIETTGLTNTPLFLIGTLRLEEEGPVVRQYLARDYAEERAVLELFLAECPPEAVYVTFNGKSFDLPYIRIRLAYHRVPWPAVRPHFDLLHEARRVWRGSLPNCRLTTLESEICGRHRVDDIEGALIPEAYHRFVRTGDAAQIAQIVRHNRMDLWTMAELLTYLPPVSPEDSGWPGPGAATRPR